MADITGMFQDPNAIRQARIDDILKQYQATSQMGGSMNQLLGQVAAAGSNVGSLMAEGAAGMFGMSTPEEAKAAELQAMMQSIDPNSPDQLAEMAKIMNGLGYTKEAIAVMDKRQSVLNQQAADEDRATKIAQGPAPRIEEKTVWIPRTTSKGKPVLDDNGDPVFEPKTIKTYYDWNNTTKKWEKRGDAATASEGGDMKIHDEASFNEYLMKRYQGGQP
jgi:hypothetical protein